VVEKAYQLVWTNQSEQQILKAYKYISEDSVINAKKVIEDIIIATEKALYNPEYYPIDKYKIDNDGSYRSFEKHGYRISYRFTKIIIRVLRVRHTKMKPKKY
jgi:plasmid stabilization system protein ParE